MRREPAEYVIERDYNGADLMTDGKVFFAKDAQGKRFAEFKTLEAVKRAILKPTKIDIQGVILEDGYSYDDDDFKPIRIRVYAVSGAGSILYEVLGNGEKKKDSWGTKIRAFDAAKLERFVTLKAEKLRIEAELESLLGDWPILRAADLKGTVNGDETKTES